MKRLLLAVCFVLMAAGTATARDRFSYDLSLGFPLYFYPMPAPDRHHPVTTVQKPKQVSLPVFSYAPPRVHRERDGSRRIVEEIYRDGRLVERRVKCYPAHWAGYRK